MRLYLLITALTCALAMKSSMSYGLETPSFLGVDKMRGFVASLVPSPKVESSPVVSTTTATPDSTASSPSAPSPPVAPTPPIVEVTPASTSSAAVPATPASSPPITPVVPGVQPVPATTAVPAAPAPVAPATVPLTQPASSTSVATPAPAPQAATPTASVAPVGQPTPVAPVTPAAAATAVTTPVLSTVAPPTPPQVSPTPAAPPKAQYQVLSPNAPAIETTKKPVPPPKPLTDAMALDSIKQQVTKLKKAQETKETKNIAIQYELGNSQAVDLEDDGLTTPNLFGIQVQKKNSLDLGKLINDAYNASLVGQTEASLNLYQQALQAEPNNQNILYAIGTLYHNLHQLDQAKVYYKKILSLDPNHSKAMSNFISVIAEEAPERALGQLQELARQNPNFSPVQAQIGMIYAKQNDLVTAEQYLRRASALSPEVMMYRYNLAVLYERMHLKEEAVRIYKQVLEASYQGYNIPVGANVIKERIYALTDASGR